jgi:sarcosine oxidase subunit beta
MESLKTYDVVVIGAGVNGCGAAYHLAREGYTVAVVEQGTIAGEASGRNAGGIRQHGRSKAEMPLAMNAIGQWMRFRDEFGGQFEYIQKGNLIAGYTDEQQQEMANNAQQQRDQGLEVQHITDKKVIKELAPALTDQAICINFVASDGKAQPVKATRFVAKLAKQHGAKFYTFTKVTKLVRTGDAISGVETTQGFIPTRSVIAASGPWAISLLKDMGIKLPMLVRRTQICVTAPLPHFIDQWITSGSIYLHQTLAGGVIIGGGGPWESISFTKECTLPSLQRFSRRAQQVVPALKNARLLRGWAGCLDITPDFQVIIDKIREVEGLVICVGTCGHGFALGPAVGQACAEMATGRKPSVPIEGLSLYRFAPNMDFKTTYKTAPEPL